MRTRLKNFIPFFVAFLFAVALWKGYTRGGQDFRVFDFAARLALGGKWETLYQDGPDRFLYAPGFAILFSPFALLPVASAHAAWLAFITICFYFSMRLLAGRLGVLAVSLGILFSMRAVWIDLRYGQVNLLILSSAVFALLTLFSRPMTRDSGARVLAVSWFLFGLSIISKIYPTALLAFPFWVLINSRERGEKRRGMIALGAAFAGMAFILLLPFVFAPDAGSFLYAEWVSALARKGLPTDTHNQSIVAFLFRMLSGETFFSLSLGGAPLRSSVKLLGALEIRVIWALFTLVTAAFFIRTVIRVRKFQPELQVALGIALCFLPAHLIWKPYFLMAIPLASVLACKKAYLPLALLGIIVSFSSNSIVGPEKAAWLEAGSLFLWVHLTLIRTALTTENQALPVKSTEA